MASPLGAFRSSSGGLRTTGGPRVSRKDRIVQSTDTDALSSKYSAYKKGYLADPYLEAIVSGFLVQEQQHYHGRGTHSAGQFVNKMPIINIGSCVRHLAVTRLVDLFLESTEKCQIISLGAGSDTRPFSLLAKYNKQTAASDNAADVKLIYHELDFAVTTTKKALTIFNSPLLSDIIYHASPRPQTPPGAEIHTPDYHLHAADLRTLNATTPLLPGMDPTLPTLVISECCLCYLQPDESDQVFSFLVTNFGHAGLGMILYEPIGGNDAFSQVMVENLATRGISLPTLQRFPTLQAEVHRLADRGMGVPRAADMMYIYERWISREEKQRISRLEFLDELEELRLLLSHYCVAWTVTPNSPAAWVDAYETQLPYQV